MGSNLWWRQRFDPVTGNFITYTPENLNTIQYQEIKEDSKGILWVGEQSGLHRFDPQTGQFTIYGHDPDDPRTLSDNRVNSVHFDRSGNLWIGTQNGLDRFEADTGAFKANYRKWSRRRRGELYFGRQARPALDGYQQWFIELRSAVAKISELFRGGRTSRAGSDGLGRLLPEPERRDVFGRFQRRHGLLSHPDCEQFICPEDGIDGFPAVRELGSDRLRVTAQAIHHLH